MWEREKGACVRVRLQKIKYDSLCHCTSPSPLTSFLPSQVQYFPVVCCPLLRTLVRHTPTHPPTITLYNITYTYNHLCNTHTHLYPPTNTCVCEIERKRERKSLDQKPSPRSSPVATTAAAQKLYFHIHTLSSQWNTALHSISYNSCLPTDKKTPEKKKKKKQ